jgi:hypothetical protein
MEKNTIVAISLISAVISLIYLLLSYFGIIRYGSIYLYSIESYSRNYKNLDRVDNNHRVIISLKADKNINKLDKTIKSLLDQTVKVDFITLILPSTSKFSLENNLENVLKIDKCDNDYGNLTCLIPNLLREGDAQTQIILLKTGFIYGKDFIETILEKSQKNPNSIIYTKNKKDNLNLSKAVLVTTDMFSAKFIDETSTKKDKDKWFNEYIKDINKISIKDRENYKII